MDNKKFILGLLVFLFAVTAYNQYIVYPKQQEQARLEALRAEEEAAKNPASAPTAPAAGPAAVLPEAVVSSNPEVFYDFTSPSAKIKFSSKGAGISEFLFQDVVEEVDLTPYEGEGFFATMPGLDFKLAGKEDKNFISFTALYGGVVINKKYTFKEDGINSLDITFENKGKADIALPSDFYYFFGPGLGTVRSEKSENEREMKAVYVNKLENKKNPSLNIIKIKKDAVTENPGSYIWTGIQNRYFLAALIPHNFKTASLTANKKVLGKQASFFGLWNSEISGPWLKASAEPLGVLKAGETKTLEASFYFGPKDYTALQELPYHLDRSVEFGFFGSLGRLARTILDTLYKYTGNYGVSIIIFALLLQLLLLRLTVMQFKSSLSMKKVQPEMKRLQDTYKNDPQRLQTEMLALYKKHNFNPASGCLPLLIQLPIFMALFNAFRTSWSLHGAGFALWITDLSSKDPYYVLPVIMGAIMFFQQRLTTPTAGMDPTQAAMMKWMPVIFTVLFINFPAGLVLYWLTNSIISFCVQLYLNRKYAK